MAAPITPRPNPIARSPLVIEAKGTYALGEVYPGAEPRDWRALLDQLDQVGLVVVPRSDL